MNNGRCCGCCTELATNGGFNNVRVISVETIKVEIRLEKGGKVSLDNRLRSYGECLGGQGGALDDTQGFTSTFCQWLGTLRPNPRAKGGN